MNQAQDMLAKRAPKAFRNLYDSRLTATEILQGFAQALGNVTNSHTGQLAWNLDKQAQPMPGQPTGLQATARATYTYGNSNWAVILTAAVVPGTQQGTALMLIFSDALGWENGQPEILVDMTMRTVSYILDNRWGNRGWRMYSGQWLRRHEFSAPTIDPSTYDGDWQLPNDQVIPFELPKPNLPDDLFQNPQYSRYFFQHSWVLDKERAHASLLGAVAHLFLLHDVRTTRYETAIMTSMTSGDGLTQHMRIVVEDRWGGVTVSLIFALAEGWDEREWGSTKNDLLAQLPRLAPDALPDGRMLDGPVLVPLSQADLFRCWKTSVIFRKQVWGVDTIGLLKRLQGPLDGFFDMNFMNGDAPGSINGFGRSRSSSDLALNVLLTPSQGGVDLGLSFADPGHWQDADVKAAMREAYAGIAQVLDAFQQDLVLDQALCLWSLSVQGVTDLPALLQAVLQAARVRWITLDTTPPEYRDRHLYLDGFLPGQLPVQVNLTVTPFDEGFHVTLILRQNEFNLPSISEETGNATVEDIKRTVSSVSPAITQSPMCHLSLDQLLEIGW